jgi:hypothetical protein
MSEGRLIKLHYTLGSSDKEYVINLRPSGSRWDVKVEYGRKWNSKQRAFKAVGVSYAEATETLEKTLRSKLKKGYQIVYEGSS